MKGALHRFSLEGRPCACFAPQKEGPLPLLVLCGWGMEEKLPSLSQELPPALLFFARAEGDRDFTPWPAPGVREGEAFTGEAGAYLEFLTKAALPCLERGFGASPRPEGRGILGYSLGGLFALWAQAQSGAFQAAGSLSGSLWYPGWLDYMEQHPPRPGEKIYLSLGDREEFGGPPLLRTVGDCTRRAHAFYKEKGLDTVLEWNKGGHGKGVDARWKKALAWMCRAVDEKEGGRKTR